MEKSNVFSEFGSLVFSESLMQQRLSQQVFEKYKEVQKSQAKLDKPTADAIAEAMKQWALEKGCTHFCHWFQPLTGATAEKHDSFITRNGEGNLALEFTGKSLIKGEPDASSFPSGGLRSTFEARGYTYWDVTSPAFIRENVLCVPSVFISYTGESLDKKAPLLKAMDLVSNRATSLLNKIGYPDVKSVTPMVGLEQEYFLIDRPLYKERLDLKLIGRTIFGHEAPKDQESSGHYFGTIPSRVIEFMKEVDDELYRLGIYEKTEHNEVAPRQFEVAPLFTDANTAVDQNQMMMDILKRVAYKHGFACLLHEKPFASTNGSGKHNNYSLQSDTGLNLFDFGKTEEEHKRFYLFVACFVEAVDKYPELLRLTTASSGNDFRLGCNEAPPAIISIFLGEYIENMIADYIGKEHHSMKDLKPIEGLAYVSRDRTDRNRTSPVAFTGNKFEFRMLGSSASAAFANTVLSVILADSFSNVIERLEKAEGKDTETVIHDYVTEVFNNHSRVLFSQDGYSEAWVKEAKRRGLPNITSSIEAVSYYTAPKNVELLTKYGIFTEAEIEARSQVEISQYIESVGLEVKTMINMAESFIVPFMVKELTSLLPLKDLNKVVGGRFERISGYLEELDTKLALVKSSYDEIMALKERTESRTGSVPYRSALRLHREIVPMLAEVRQVIDAYEKEASKEIYTLPTYTDILF